MKSVRKVVFVLPRGNTATFSLNSICFDFFTFRVMWEEFGHICWIHNKPSTFFTTKKPKYSEIWNLYNLSTSLVPVKRLRAVPWCFEIWMWASFREPLWSNQRQYDKFRVERMLQLQRFGLQKLKNYNPKCIIVVPKRLYITLSSCLRFSRSRSTFPRCWFFFISPKIYRNIFTYI